ncbi:MAG: hypothetical protein N3F03_07680 [Ignavibacteria bacterium]|nr:hypothetical protein [Ignavibacteria bacterium]
MIKFFIFTFVFMSFLIDYIFTQTNVKATISINASLKKGISVVSENEAIDFGELVLTSTPMEVYKAPNDGYKFKIISHPFKPVMINFEPVQLHKLENTGQIGSNSLIFIPKVFHTSSNPDFVNPVEVQPGVYYQPQNQLGLGILNVWVGGTLKISSNNEGGEYSGDLVLTISY